MLSWLRGLFSRPDDRSSVTFDAEAIRVREPGGSQRKMRWSDLGSVIVLTNDSGPFATDVHWVLTDRGGGTRLVLPMGIAGDQALLGELQRRLPGFDNEAVISAMGSTANAEFVVWRAPS